MGEGKVADYIPALAKVNPQQFGIAIYSNDGQLYQVGDAETPFSIQSISKVFSLTLAIKHYGPDLWQRVGREPSGLPFNSLVQLEYENGVPRNPFINSGALVVSDITTQGSLPPITRCKGSCVGYPVTLVFKPIRWLLILNLNFVPVMRRWLI
ncbi:glutaminase [Maribrevibacterium harenarium]|uniref:glutaminase n=1 Tax=Maribrevibacterium harenarium TaxID=2589817 RepID=UPI0038B2A2DC